MIIDRRGVRTKHLWMGEEKKRTMDAKKKKNPERWEDKQEEGCSRIHTKEFQGEVAIK